MTAYWYEVFKSNRQDGSQSLYSCNTLKKARKFKQQHLKTAQLLGYELHIDKWTTIDTIPEPIKEIE